MTPEPRWIEPRWIDAIHNDQIKRYGGRHGVRDRTLIESAVMRPRNHWSYNPEVTLVELAALYGVGLTKNHGYVDGNKRIGFMTMFIFLGYNGYLLQAPEPEVVFIMNDIASGAVTEKEVAEWLAKHIQPKD